MVKFDFLLRDGKGRIIPSILDSNDHPWELFNSSFNYAVGRLIVKEKPFTLPFVFRGVHGYMSVKL